MQCLSFGLELHMQDTPPVSRSPGLRVCCHAALPTFWQVSTEAELLRGDVENLAIDSFGRLTLGPTTATVYDASAPFLWTVDQRA